MNINSFLLNSTRFLTSYSSYGFFQFVTIVNRRRPLRSLLCVSFTDRVSLENENLILLTLV